MNTEILEGNKLIHKFMGGKWYSKRYPRNHGVGGSMLDLSDNAPDIIIEKAKYHSSWDWLMPVKYKIDSIDNHEYDVIIWRSDCHINNRTQLLFESSILKGNKTLIEIVWGCIVEFIKWYNLNQPTKNKVTMKTASEILFEYGIDIMKMNDDFNSQLLFAMERYADQFKPSPSSTVEQTTSQKGLVELIEWAKEEEKHQPTGRVSFIELITKATELLT